MMQAVDTEQTFEPWSEGAFNVRQGRDFLSCSRSRLYDLMAADLVLWGLDGSHRKLCKASMRHYLSTLPQEERERPGQ